MWKLCSVRNLVMAFSGVAVLAAGLWGGGLWAQSMRADRILVLKGERLMFLVKDDQVIKTYRISLGFQPEGAKTRRGDGRTPEGVYRIDRRNPNSRFHLALHVSYPDSSDREYARRMGVDPGGDIMIHGLPNGHGPRWQTKRFTDWTAGCIAVSDREIEEIWRAVPDGARIDILP